MFQLETRGKHNMCVVTRVICMLYMHITHSHLQHTSDGYSATHAFVLTMPLQLTVQGWRSDLVPFTL